MRQIIILSQLLARFALTSSGFRSCFFKLPYTLSVSIPAGLAKSAVAVTTLEMQFALVLNDGQ